MRLDWKLVALRDQEAPRLATRLVTVETSQRCEEYCSMTERVHKKFLLGTQGNMFWDRGCQKLSLLTCHSCSEGPP